MENFELISPSIKEIKVRDSLIKFESNFSKYENLGIMRRSFDNPKNLIGFADLVRYIQAINPDILAATEDEITAHIPVELPKIMTIDQFHYESRFSGNPPSAQETFQLIAKVLVTKNSSMLNPTLKPNNHWSNWISGNL